MRPSKITSNEKQRRSQWFINNSFYWKHVISTNWDLVKNSTLCNYKGNFSFSILDDDWEWVDNSGARVIYKCSKSSSKFEKVYC